MRRIYLFWMKLAAKSVEMQMSVILRIIYYLLMFPVGFWYRITGVINRCKNQRTNWQDWDFMQNTDETRKM